MKKRIAIILTAILMTLTSVQMVSAGTVEGKGYSSAEKAVTAYIKGM